MPLTFGLRPRFRMVSGATPERCRDRVLHVAGDYLVGSFDRYLIIEIPEVRRHYWSPHLQLTLDEAEEGGGQTLVRGLITPRPAVWTLFAGAYGSIVVLGFFASVYGLVQWQLGQPSAWRWAPVITALLLALVYAASRVGQHLGRAQTDELVTFLETCLQED